MCFDEHLITSLGEMSTAVVLWLMAFTAFRDEWFHDIPAMMAKTDALYAELVKAGKTESRNATTKKKIYEERGWLRRFVEENFDSVLDRLQVFYLPKALRPGPCFVFPLRDIESRYNTAQVRPFTDSYLFKEDRKYRLLGTDRAFKGPYWFGNDARTLQKVIEKEKVCLVEGPFDVLACKCLAPDAPVMSSLTRSISEDHVDYLRILGVKTIVLLFDYEYSEQGSKGMESTKWNVEHKYAPGAGLEVVDLTGSGTDPSESLKKEFTASELRYKLNKL
jgi:hypothetical protein